LYHKTGVSAREKAASVIDPDAGMWYNIQNRGSGGIAVYPKPVIRKHIIFTGSVQGVGFRYRARHAAELYGCTG